MNREKLCCILYFVASLFLYVAAILGFTGGEKTMGVIYLCLGSAMLCLGAAKLNKYNKDKKNADANEDNIPDDGKN